MSKTLSSNLCNPYDPKKNNRADYDENKNNQKNNKKKNRKNDSGTDGTLLCVPTLWSVHGEV